MAGQLAVQSIDDQLLGAFHEASRKLLTAKLREKAEKAGIFLTTGQLNELNAFERTGNVGDWADTLPNTINFDDDDWREVQDQTSNLLAKLPAEIKSLTEELASGTLRSIRADWKKRKFHIKADKIAFRHRLKSRWGTAYDELHLLIILCAEVGEEELEHLRRSRRKTGKVLKDTLIRLHSRACQISGEILVLLESGYADGAMARWRTLHELSVIAAVLARGDDELATRYRLHEVVDAKKAMDLYIRDHHGLGYQPPSVEEIDRTNSHYDELIKIYGKSFSNPYGWAAELLKNKRPQFSDLQTSAGREIMASFYKMASYPVHADFKGAAWQLGKLGQNDFVLAGPSNAGIEEPGQNMALSLVSTTSLLVTDATLEKAVPLKAIGLQRDRAIQALIAAGRRLTNDEQNRLRKEAPETIRSNRTGIKKP